MSGAKASRPGLDHLIADARKRKFDIVVVWKLDRFGRSLVHCVSGIQELASLGIRFIVSVRPTQVREGEPWSCSREDSVGRLDSDKQNVPAKMFAGGSGPSTGKRLFRQLEIRHFVRLHENPVWKGTAAEAGNLISQQLDCAVKHPVIMRLHNAPLAVVDKPDHPFLFDRLPEQRIRLQHPFLFSPVNNRAREMPSSGPG
jgi:Resolvase, N terminal domain